MRFGGSTWKCSSYIGAHESEWKSLLASMSNISTGSSLKGIEAGGTWKSCLFKGVDGSFCGRRCKLPQGWKLIYHGLLLYSHRRFYLDVSTRLPFNFHFDFQNFPFGFQNFHFDFQNFHFVFLNLLFDFFHFHFDLYHLHFYF